MSTSPFMDGYSSEDYSDHDDDYYFVPSTTPPPQVRAQVEVQAESDELQNVIIDQQEDVSESVYFEVLPELEAAEPAEEEGGGMEQSAYYLAVESYFDAEAQVETTGVAGALEAGTEVEELTVESCLELEAQAETGLQPAALDTETTVLEEGDAIESESLETVEADTVVETTESMIQEFNYEVVESESDLKAENGIEEPGSDVERDADAVAPEAETTVGEEDVIDELPETVAAGAAGAALNPDTAVEEGIVIGEPIYDAVESDYDPEVESKTEDMVEEEDDVVEEEEDRIEEEDDIEVEDDVVEEEEDMVEEEDDAVEEEEDMIEEEEDVVEEEDDISEKEDAFVEEHDVIDEPVESDNTLQAEAEAEASVEGAAMEESIYEPLESNSYLQAAEPRALAEPAAVSIEMTTFKAYEPADSDLDPEAPEDLIDEPSDSREAESALREEEWDSELDPEDMDKDFSDSDLPEEEADDAVTVSYSNSSTPIRNEAWKMSVPASLLALAKLPGVTDTTTTVEDSSLQESFLGCNPVLVWQECGNAVMNVMEASVCELLRIRDDLRRALEALFRKRERETTKHT